MQNSAVAKLKLAILNLYYDMIQSVQSVSNGFNLLMNYGVIQVKVWVGSPLKVTVVSLSKNLYDLCLVLVGSRNRLDHDLNVKPN